MEKPSSYNHLVRCLSCQYSLRHLTKLRCPECGREFDPNDRETFDDGRMSSTGWTIVLVVVVFLAIAFAMVASIAYEVWRGISC